MELKPSNVSPVLGSRRGKPGRPQKGDAGIFQPMESGHNLGTGLPEMQARSGDAVRAVVQYTPAPLVPRLLDLHMAASYLGLSEWSVRDLEQGGTLKRVRIPLPKQGELRKLLFDKSDLDRLVEIWKGAS